MPLTQQNVCNWQTYFYPRLLTQYFGGTGNSISFLFIEQSHDYQLIDLQSMPDDEIVKKKHLGVLEYMLKNIHQRDMFMLWEEFLTKFKHQILVDKGRGYIYIKSFLWYTDAKLTEEQQPELERILTHHLSLEGEENLMRTIAQKYIDEGKAEGEARGKAELVKTMLANGVSIETYLK